jgi:hypothetical protein
MLHGLIWVVVLAVVGLALTPLGTDLLEIDLQGWHFAASGGGLAIAGLILTVAVSRLRWQRWRYEIDAGELYLQEGLIVRRRTLIPMVRIQNIDTRHGPLSRLLGLAQVDVSTAAATHAIPALSEQEADTLRDRISKLVQETGRDE